MNQSIAVAPLKRQISYKVGPVPQTPWYSRYETTVWPIGAVIIMTLIWEVGCRVFQVPEFILPPPWQVIVTLGKNADFLASNALITILEIAAGFFISLAFGIFLAVLIVAFKPFERIMFPILVVSQTVPKIAIAPLFLIWFGLGWTPKVLTAATIAFFPIVIGMVAGMQSVPVSLLELAKSMGTSRIHTMTRFLMPYALPSLFAGIQVSITLAVLGAIVGEFMGASQGLGYVILRAGGLMETPLMFAAIVVLAGVGMVLFYVVQIVQRICLPWHVSTRLAARETA